MSEENPINTIKTIADETLRRITTTKIHAPKNALIKGEIIEELRTVLDDNIQKQIDEKLKISPFILIIGDDDKARIAANYAFCNRNIDHRDTRGCLTRFDYIDCLGKDFRVFFQEIRDKILYGLTSGYTMFLRRLESGDNAECIQLTKDMMDFMSKKQVDRTELFIMSTDSTYNLPDYLIYLFETIELDPRSDMYKINYN